MRNNLFTLCIFFLFAPFRVAFLKCQTDLTMYIFCRFLMLFYVNMKNPFKLQGSGKNLLSSYNKGLYAEIVFHCSLKLTFNNLLVGH